MECQPPPDPAPATGWDILTPDDLALVRRCQSGDQQAFADLQRRFYAPVRRYVGAWLEDEENAEDVAVEVFFRLYCSIAKLKDPRKFLPFMFRLARNVCVRLIERRQRQPVEEVSMENWSAREGDLTEAPALVVPGPEEDLRQKELRRVIRGAVSRLSPLEREPFLLRYQEQFSYEQIARMLSVSIETARYRVRQARRRLQTLLPADILE